MDIRRDRKQHLEIGAGVLAGVVAAALALAVDQVIEPPVHLAAGNARGLLAATFGALVTAGAFSFWMLPIAAQLAASSVPPPTAADHLRDPFQRRVIAATLGGLTFTALTALALPAAPEADAPTLTTAIAGFLGVAGIAALLVAIQHAVRSTQPSTIVSEVATDVIARIEQAGSTTDRDDPRPSTTRQVVACEVLAPATGWLHRVDDAGLLGDVPDGSTVSLEVGLGSFVVQGWTRVATVRTPPGGGGADGLDDALHRRFVVADSRGSEHDLVGSLTRFTDIAVHAGTGASGAPSIVYESLWYLGAILHALAGRDVGRVERHHDGDRTLEWHAQPDAPELARLAIERIRRVTASEPAMALELVRVLVDASHGASLAGDEALLEVVDEQIDLAVRQCRHADPLRSDLDAVVAAAGRGEHDGPADRAEEYPGGRQATHAASA